MLPGPVLFKGHHISWKKEQMWGFFQSKKNNFIFIFSKFQKASKLKIYFSGFAILWGLGWFNLQNFWSPLNYFLQCGSLLIENLQTHSNIHQKMLHFKIFFSSMSRKFTKKGQNLFFKELIEHFRRKSVL